MLSNTCIYAIRAVLYLALNAENGNKIGIKIIARDLGIPTPFLGKILQSLAKQKLLSSTKGPNGGFGLGRNPSEILLMDVVEIIDGMDNFHKCVIGVKYCTDQENHCTVHLRYAELREEIRKIFELETIGHLVDSIKSGTHSFVI